jgi:hypothetical protein
MKREMLLGLGFCGSLLAVSAFAGDRGETARGSAPGTTVSSEEKAEVEADVSRGLASGAAAGKTKRAGTGTAAGYIHDQVKKGNIKIQGATDADIYK